MRCASSLVTTAYDKYASFLGIASLANFIRFGGTFYVAIKNRLFTKPSIFKRVPSNCIVIMKRNTLIGDMQISLPYRSVREALFGLLL